MRSLFRVWHPVLLAGVLLSACSYDYFYQQDIHPPSQDQILETADTSFGRRLPNALNEVFAACHDPLVISPGVLDPAGTCDALTDVSSDGATKVLAALMLSPDIDLASAFPANLEELLNEPFVVGLPWPFQNCVISIVPHMTIEGLSLNEEYAVWTTHDGEPALKLDFDPDDSVIASGHINSYIGNCNSPISALILENTVLPALPSGHHDIEVDDLDLDIWFSFSFSGSHVTVTVESDLSFSSIKLDPSLSSTAQDYVGTFQEALETYTGTSIEDLQADLSATLAAALGSIGDQLELLVEDGVPAGHAICSLVERDGKLEMHTSQFCLVNQPL